MWIQCTYYVLLVGPEVFIVSLKKFCSSLIVSVALNPRSLCASQLLCTLATQHWCPFLFFHEDST